MKSNYLGNFRFFKMASNGIANIPVELFDRCCFSKDGSAERSGRIAAFRGLLDQENDLVHFDSS